MSLFRKSGQVLQILQDAKGLITPEANFASWQAIDAALPVDSSGQSVDTDSPAACQWSLWGAIDLAALRVWDKDDRADLAFQARMFFNHATLSNRAAVSGPLREDEHDDMVRYVQSATYHIDVLQVLDQAIASCKRFRRWYSWGCDTWQYPSVYPR